MQTRRWTASVPTAFLHRRFESSGRLDAHSMVWHLADGAYEHCPAWLGCDPPTAQEAPNAF
jgi:hypothetical protein